MNKTTDAGQPETQKGTYCNQCGSSSDDCERARVPGGLACCDECRLYSSHNAPEGAANPQSLPSMWDVHRCNGKPTHTCPACWAGAYDEDGEVMSANLRKIGYPPSPAERDAAGNRRYRITVPAAPSVPEQPASETLPIGPHDWTHPAEFCDEPGCNHVTRRTCEGAAKVEKFLRDTLRGRTELLRKADPAWAKKADENIARALFEAGAEDDEPARCGTFADPPIELPAHESLPRNEAAFGRQLRLIRQDFDMTLGRLALILGCSVSALSDLERGQYPATPKRALGAGPSTKKRLKIPLSHKY